eukprot:184744-Chlamydomonas_euryale.AAC.1
MLLMLFSRPSNTALPPLSWPHAHAPHLCTSRSTPLHLTLHTFAPHSAGADAAVVRRTQRALAARGQPPVHFTVRFQMQRLTTCYLAGAVGASMSALAGHAWGRALLLKFPRVFSAGAVTREGPSPEQAAAAGHAVTLVARGYKDAGAQRGRDGQRAVFPRAGGVRCDARGAQLQGY